MVRLNKIVIPAIILSLWPFAVKGQVVLSEIMFHAPESEAYEEFIELYNISSDIWIDLTGYRLGDQLEQDELIDQGHGLLLAPHSFALVLDPGYWANSSVYNELLSQDALILAISDGAFGAYGLRDDPPDTVLLLNPAGDTLASFTYSPDNPSGFSEEKIRLDWGDGVSNWASSLTYLGTPGFSNSVQSPNLDLAVASLTALPNPLPSGTPLALTAVLENLGLESTPPGQIFFAAGASDASEPDSVLCAMDYTALAPADSASIALVLPSLSPGPHRLWVWHSLDDAQPENDSLSLLLPGGYPAGSVILNELMAHPAGDEAEWVELYNPGLAAVDLLGYSFSDADTADRRIWMDSSVVLAPGEFALLAEDSSVFSLSLPENLLVCVLGGDWLYLNDNGDTPTLFDAAGQVQDAVPYAGWLLPEGISLERLYASYPAADPLNWQPSLDPSGGTPGRVNSANPPPEPPPASDPLSFSPDPFDPERHGALSITLVPPQETAAAALIAFDLRGRRLKVIFDNSLSSWQQVLWDGRDSESRLLLPGLYVMFAEFRDGSGKRLATVKKTLVVAGRL